MPGSERGLPSAGAPVAIAAPPRRAACPPALRAYLLLASALAPLWRWALHRRLAHGKETPQSIREKLGHDLAMRPDGPLVWGHAVGVGEALALAGLFARLAALRPDCNFLLTTTARTSGDALHKTGLPPRCRHQFSPVDTPDAAARFLDHWRPALAIWCEMDLWPALIHATDERRIPRVLVNARLSPHSLAKRRWGRWIYQALLPGFRDVFAQNDETAEALVSLGAERVRITVSGTIKSLAPPLSCDGAVLDRWRQALAARPVWLLASSHAGEEEVALAAHAALRRQFPDALLIVAPRAPARGAEVAALCPTGTPRRAGGDALPGAAAVYVADTIGEMGLWYRLASVALVGGSLAAVGGHNPHEPQALGCAVLHGPNVWNFAESYSLLERQRASRLVLDAAQVAVAVAEVWTAPPRRDAVSDADPALAALLQAFGRHLPAA